MNVGYIRVSTEDQNEERQIAQMQEKQIDKIYMEKVSGKNTERPQLKMMLDFVREGDVVYVTDFSRLSRSTKDLLEIMDFLEGKNVRLVSLKEDFDTDTPTGKLMTTMLGAINEFERANILERQKEGIAIAKQHGKYKGRARKEIENFNDVYGQWKAGNITGAEACRFLNVSRPTFYSRVREREQGQKKMT